MKVAIHNRGLGSIYEADTHPGVTWHSSVPQPELLKLVHGRWSGPLILLQKTKDFLERGNVSATRRLLQAVEKTPFLRSEVEAAKRKCNNTQHQELKGQLSTWM
jgi:hypothetical protein